MNRQSNRIKADRKHASTENQDSRGVDNEIKWEPEQDGSLIRREGGSFFLKETGEELEELTGNGIEELLMSKGGRFFTRGHIAHRGILQWREMAAHWSAYGDPFSVYVTDLPR